ncbi:hypothetical protein CEXT_790631 [Caerostris extrusa]|uniref:Uncharacterized protein n=1 Tax=Caerostris extrusa TaxID=172846 RepID=A0AAV4XD88_CAEEX|nr:hypothetical protein CEXT_790631 [Caerostris extrusa]
MRENLQASTCSCRKMESFREDVTVTGLGVFKLERRIILAGLGAAISYELFARPIDGKRVSFFKTSQTANYSSAAGNIKRDAIRKLRYSESASRKIKTFIKEQAEMDAHFIKKELLPAFENPSPDEIESSEEEPTPKRERENKMNEICELIIGQNQCQKCKAFYRLMWKEGSRPKQRVSPFLPHMPRAKQKNVFKRLLMTFITIESNQHALGNVADMTVEEHELFLHLASLEQQVYERSRPKKKIIEEVSNLK